jgi:hypothetical protein
MRQAGDGPTFDSRALECAVAAAAALLAADGIRAALAPLRAVLAVLLGI